MLVRFSGAAVDPLWSDLDLTINPGEFLAILGPNGAGKSTLFRTLLGSQKLSRGTVEVDARIGYIPQQRMFDRNLPLRARDLVSLSLAHGVLSRRHARRARVDELLEEVDASGLADLPVGTMSGGQQQLIRQAQALANDPQIILADEPLLSLDVSRQQRTVEKLDRRRQERDTAIVVITHGINPVLDYVDRVLYLAPFGHRVGTVDEVMRTEVLTELYNTKVEVTRIGDRVVVM